MEWVNTSAIGRSTLPQVKPCDIQVGEIARVVSGDHAGMLVMRAEMKILVELGPSASVWTEISPAFPGFLVERLPSGTVLSFGV